MLPKSERGPTQCYIDESIHSSCGFVATAFVLAAGPFGQTVAEALRKAGLTPGKDEFKSGTRMDSNPKMKSARGSLLALASSKVRVAVFFGPFDKTTLGKQSLQALQSILVRNGIWPSRLSVYFDEGIFPSVREAYRLHRLFSYLRGCRIYPREDSRLRLGIQVADAVAHSFGQILKESLTGTKKLVEIGGPGTGYRKGTKVPLGWDLLMTLRRGLFTRPMVYDGKRYLAATDPVILDPIYDDPVVYGQHPVLLGWGVQVAPDAGESLRQGVERALGRIWLGCIH